MSKNLLNLVLGLTLLVGSAFVTSAAEARLRGYETPMEVEARGGNCHFNYESGRYYGPECPTDQQILARYKKKHKSVGPAPIEGPMAVEARGGRCRFNYESGRYDGPECPRRTNMGGFRLNTTPTEPSDFRN